jgi:tetratricopeptide (TPR) repeat protein
MSSTTTTRNLLAIAALLAATACGGGTVKTGLGSGDKVPPPPNNDGGKTGDGTGGDGAPEPVREISKDAKKDYAEAADYYASQEKTGWNEKACRETADRFRRVARSHAELVEATYMVGRSLQNCQMDGDAEAAYLAAIKINPKHAQSISNLGDIYFRAGKVEGAKSYWESAVKANGKVTGARNNLAFLLLEEMRKTKDGAAWARLEEQAREHLSSVLAVDQDNVRAYVLYGLLYMQGYEKNRSRLDLAKLLLDEGKKRKEDFAALHNAYGLLHLLKNSVGQALQSFQRAVQIDGKFVEARMNVGSITLGFRKYDTAAEEFAAVLELEPKNYDAMIGLGIANRGLAKLKEAEDNYDKAKQTDSKRSAAYFNLGVLYRDFVANGQVDLTASKKVYEKSRDFFKEALNKGDLTADQTADAKDNVSDLDKIIKQLDEVIKATAAAGAAGGTPP